MGELAIRGATVVTVAPGLTVADGTIEGDVVVDGGRIVAIGVDEGAGADEQIDARGCIVVPGFVQAHVHLCQTLFRGLADDQDVIDWLRERVWPLERGHDAASMRASCELGIAELLLGGTTSVLSMESIAHTAESYAAAERMGIRATIGKALMDRWEPGTEMVGESTDQAWDDQVALMERWHGAGDGRVRVALSPRGPRNATPEMWRRCVELADAADLRLHTHVDENHDQAARFGATDEGRDVVALRWWGALNERLVMAHCVWLDEQERDLVRRHGPHVCHCPSANLKLASGIAPIPELLADGVNVALGADGAACNNRLDQFEEMRLAALVHKPRCGPRSMPAGTVLEMATMGGARALGIDHEVGSIEVGKQADLVVVDTAGAHVRPGPGSRPEVRLVYGARAGDVRDVFVAGRPVVRDRRLLTADLAEVVAEADEQRTALLSRVPLA
jgi:cytosine/adenosine deaminase-related metal-dependent hydrolase